MHADEETQSSAKPAPTSKGKRPLGQAKREEGPSGRALAPTLPAGEGPHMAPLATQQERALALLCQGMRPAAIAERLGTTPATVRRWLRKRFEALAREARDEHGAALLRAIKSQREIARAAWESYQHEREVEAAILRGDLDYVRRRAVRRTGGARGAGQRRSRREARVNGDSSVEPEESGDEVGEEVLLEELERPRHPSQGARYLTVALAAQREMARLQGLYDEIAQQPAEISITITRRPDGPENIPPGERPALPAPIYDDGEDACEDEEGAAESEDKP